MLVCQVQRLNIVVINAMVVLHRGGYTFFGHLSYFVCVRATSWEREGLRTGFDASLESLRHVQLRPAVVAPVGEARSDTAIVLALAGRLGLDARMFGLDADTGHAAVLAPSGLSIEALRANPLGLRFDGGVPLQAHAMEVDGTPRGFPTPTRKMEIYSEQLLAAKQRPLPTAEADDLSPVDARFPLRLSSAKSVAYCHSQHRNIASLRRLAPDPVLELSGADAADRAIAHGDWVTVRTAVGAAVAKAVIVAGLAPGSVFGQHGWWVAGGSDTPYGANHPLTASLNSAIPTDRADPVSGSLPLRCTWCEVARIVG